MDKTSHQAHKKRGRPYTRALPMGILLASLAGVTLAGCDSQASDTEDTKDVAHIRIAAAANMSDVLPPIIEAYQQRQAQADIAVTDIDVTYASSGKLYAQIEAGAPYDVFLSANQDFPAKLAATHVGTAPFSYTRGQLALYSITQPLGAPTANTVPALYRTTTPLKITLANGKLAPYGAAAAHYLQQASQGASLPKNVQTIQAENIGQAFQYTHSGSVDYGFVALSQLVATKTPKSAYTVLPVAGYPALLQDGIVLSDKPAAQGFARHLQSAEAQDILTRSGYLPVSDAQ